MFLYGFEKSLEAPWHGLKTIFDFPTNDVQTDVWPSSCSWATVPFQLSTWVPCSEDDHLQGSFPSIVTSLRNSHSSDWLSVSADVSCDHSLSNQNPIICRCLAVPTGEFLCETIEEILPTRTREWECWLVVVLIYLSDPGYSCSQWDRLTLPGGAVLGGSSQPQMGDNLSNNTSRRGLLWDLSGLSEEKGRIFQLWQTKLRGEQHWGGYFWRR